MQSEQKEENITISITNTKEPDQTAPLSKEDLLEKRKTFKEDSNNLINNALNFFTNLVEETITLEKINCLNALLYNVLIFLDTNSSELINVNNVDIRKIDAETVTQEQAIAIYELGLWKRVNDYLERNEIGINIMDNIYFIKEIKDYINNVLYKNI